MKAYESSVLRPFGSLVHGVLILSLIAGVLWGFSILFLFGAAGRWRDAYVEQALVQPLFLGALALLAVIGLPTTLTVFARNRGSYRAGPTDLEVTAGWLHRETRWLQYKNMTEIDLVQGPLMRLLGTHDVKIRHGQYGAEVVLHGVRDARELRLHLLDRRDSLRDLEDDPE